jgi:hypothetical protein
VPPTSYAPSTVQRWSLSSSRLALRQPGLDGRLVPDTDLWPGNYMRGLLANHQILQAYKIFTWLVTAAVGVVAAGQSYGGTKAAGGRNALTPIQEWTRAQYESFVLSSLTPEEVKSRKAAAESSPPSAHATPVPGIADGAPATGTT